MPFWWRSHACHTHALISTGPVHHGLGRHFCRNRLLSVDGLMPQRFSSVLTLLVQPSHPSPPHARHQVQTDASVTIRPLMLPPAQRVSQI